MPAAPTLDCMTGLTGLTGLRGLAALWVLGYHAWSIPGGYLGVDLFFALSGFVLALNYGDAALHASPRRYGQFLGKRLVRLYPAHLCALLLTLACGLIYSLAVSGAPLLCTPVALALGRLSYSLYLVNWPIIELCQRLARLSRSTLPDALVTAIGAAVALFVAHLVYRYVEEPARRGLARRWLRREPLPS